MFPAKRSPLKGLGYASDKLLGRFRYVTFQRLDTLTRLAYAGKLVAKVRKQGVSFLVSLKGPTFRFCGFWKARERRVGCF
jgi:hypothetical protein